MNEVSSKVSRYPQNATVGGSAINILIGIWLILSPFVVTAFVGLQNARWNNVIVGILVAIFGLVRLSNYSKTGWSWCNFVLGIWLIISPFALAFSSVTVAVWHNVIVGIVVGLLAWSGAQAPRTASVSS